MASKTKAAQKEKEKDEAPEKEASEAPDTPLPLLDLSDAAVKKLIRTAKKRGYVTHDQINSVLPSEEVNSEQIEDVLSMFSEMGVNVVENEEAEPEEEGAAREEAGREAMIAGLCESPLTFQAIIIWRDELNEGKVFLRDIIDLEATYAGPDAKLMPAPAVVAEPQPFGTAPLTAATPVLAQTPAPPAAPPNATP